MEYSIRKAVSPPGVAVLIVPQARGFQRKITTPSTLFDAPYSMHLFERAGLD
jgi:hypothetical protein